VYLEDGAVLPADLVLIAIGALPDTELAENAGVKTDDGIVVDQRLQTARGAGRDPELGLPVRLAARRQHRCRGVPRRR
jgi:Pyridine nucleotide-disulphide oxidoreductase